MKYQSTGEVRCPKLGEYYLNSSIYPRQTKVIVKCISNKEK